MRIYLICFLIGIVQGIFAQKAGRVFSINHEYPLTVYDSVMLTGLPELKIIPVLKADDLPYQIDNSILPYYREIYQQINSECGQVSGIAYNFTYEINRLRDLPADTSVNLYPTHFTYNFMNGGYGWGVSYFHSFEILRNLGCPTVATYGGMAEGGILRWMNGYDNYYSAMKNRIRQVYQINVGTAEGLIRLKHWLHNHLDGSTYGGVASFYANSPWNLRTLPEGTPDGGKHVIVTWAGNPTHAMTVCGYNDSIRYDYNGDSIYTNHLDINEDGVVNMRDWEIGGLLFADGWGSGINFADSGKCYMMYKTLAEKVYDGGIWNNAMHVLDVKDLETPLLTAKVTLEHSRRRCLRVQCGISGNPEDTVPEYIMGFPVFNFQGGNQYMQGGVSPEENKTIEFGLDITPLLGYIDTNSFVKIFLQVEERDPDGLAEGHIMKFSVIDYSGKDAVTYIGDTALPLVNNTCTYASVDSVPLYNSFTISDETLPTAVLGLPYAHQLSSEGGSPQYSWYLLNSYAEEELLLQIDTTGTFMEPENWDYGTIEYPLPFSFPFYNEFYDTIYIHPDGFIMFTKTEYPWPYLWDGQLFIRNTACIAPFACRHLDFVPASGHGIWVNEEENKLSIRWIADVDFGYYSPEVEFALNINEDGEITFVYGNEMEAYKIYWSCGISEGNDMRYYIPAIEDRRVIMPGDAVKLNILPLPAGLNLSEDGLYSGVPVNYYQQVDLTFCVKDDDNIRAYKSIEFSSTDLSVEEQKDQEKDLIQAYYPNPFNSQLTIRLAEGLQGPLSCQVYSSTGVLIKVLMDNKSVPGSKTIIWDGSDASGNSCPPGIYLIQCRTAGRTEVKKVIYSGL